MTRTRRILSLALALCLMLSMSALTGCGSKSESTTDTTTKPAAEKPAPIVIGTLPTEDSLPLWVAEQKGYFKDAGLDDVKIEVFQAAQERDTAFSSKSIDAFMGDLIAATNLEAAKSPVTVATVMLGADPTQGRFGIVAAPKSGISDIRQLAGVPVGTSSATIQEYVLDGLMKDAGVPADKIKKEEVKKVPVRFELLMQGKLKAAALPEPFLSLAAAQGATILRDDTASATNLSQTILGVSDTYVAEKGGAEAAAAVLKAWDRAVAEINANPEAYRKLLVEKARVPKPVETSYKIPVYATQTLPSKADVDAVLAWMKDKGYLKSDVTYEDLMLVTPKK